MPILREVKKKQTILYQGEAPSSIYIVESGLVRALNISPNGEEKTIALYGHGDHFPVEYASSKSPVALLYYESMLDCKLTLFNKDEFGERMKTKLPETIDKLTTQYISALLQINALGQTLAKDRVARIIEYLCLRFGRINPNETYTKINTPLTQLDIARVTGLTRETTAIEVSKLKKSKIILVRNKFYRVDLKRLLKSIDSDEFNDVRL